MNYRSRAPINRSRLSSTGTATSKQGRELYPTRWLEIRDQSFKELADQLTGQHPASVIVNALDASKVMNSNLPLQLLAGTARAGALA